LGFPTANIALADYVCPAKGVYAVKATQDKSADATWIDGIANYGLRPTFNKEHPILEVHLLDYDGDLYGQYLRVAFTDFIRPEIKFDSFADLQAQIPIDIAKARQSHAHDSDFRITIAKI
jgi:riboflavin kinase/FMN adenylyltransferase